MSHSQRTVFFCGWILTAACASAQVPRKPRVETPGNTPGYDVNYIGPRMADPVMQHSKETYVLFGCSYCHGLYLVARGEATDLMHSRLVGKDQNATLIGPLLRAGIPQTAKLSPMPQFSDLSDQQITDITRWIHYARQQGRYQELTEIVSPVQADAAAGKIYFESACIDCHSMESNVAGMARKYNPSALRSEILKPHILETEPSFTLDQLQAIHLEAARQRHHALLETFSLAEVSNLMAYLLSLK